MIAITGATGQLGHYVIESLMKTVPASQIVAIVRNPAKAQALAAQGITVRQADYGDEAALTSALQGVEKLLLISSSEVGQRAPQHRNVINAAKTAGVKFIAYTSLLHADTSPLGLADEHIETEKMLADSGIVYTLLRNGWYTENYLASAPAALEHGVFIGAAGDGKIASATRADYAAAAARVISEAGHEGKVYELAGDSAWTLTQLAAELTKQSGKSVTYQNLSEADFAAALKSVGLPDGLADMLADSDVGASKGGLFDNSKILTAFIPILIMVGLIFTQPNLSMVLLLLATSITIYICAGGSIMLIIYGLCAFVPLLLLKGLKGYQSSRITTWLHPESDPLGAGYNIIQSLVAFASGGLYGVGYGSSKQKLAWLPEAHTDFIYAVIGEEHGFIGCLLIICLFWTILQRGFLIACKCQDMYGKLLALGLTFSISFQGFLNMWVASSFVPATGVPMPFISYGGSSIMVSLWMVGIILNISKDNVKRVRFGNVRNIQ